MDTPLVSVILPTYNGARYIRSAIDSVLNQEYPNLELIIIDDASTDSTAEIISEYAEKDPRIVILRNQENKKLVQTLNIGIENAKGGFIARIDDDDVWGDARKISKQMEILQHTPNVAIVGSMAYIIDEDGQRTGGYIWHHSDIAAIRKGFGYKNELIHTSILARKSAILKAGCYRDEWLYVEDYDLWLRVLALGYDIMNIPEEMIEYRVRSGNTTAKKYHRMQWLTFYRLMREDRLYETRIQRFLHLSIRFFLWVTPLCIIRILKK